jgi:hypothetical protein
VQSMDPGWWLFIHLPEEDLEALKDSLKEGHE